MNTSKILRAQTQTMARMLGYEPPYQAPDVWLEIVGIPLDEWMQIQSPGQLRLAKARRAYRQLRERIIP